MTPTTTEADPVLMSQAAGALILVSPHWFGNCGSFGVAIVSRQRFGSASSTEPT